MEYEIFTIFKNYTFETLLIGFGSFLLTYLIKLPIKKKTAKLEENKRKMINTIIMFVPFVISLIASIVYYGVTQKELFSLLVLDSAVSSWIISLSMYAIVSRIWMVIRGILSGKLEVNSALTKETVSYIQDTIKVLTKENRITEKSLSSIAEKLTSLIQMRDIMTENNTNLDLIKISDLNSQISSLKKEELEAKTKIEKNTKTIEGYNMKLYQNQNKEK